MKLSGCNPEPIFCAEIDIYFDEDDGIFITCIDEISNLLRDGLGKRGVDSTHNPNIITGGNAKPIDELALDEALGLEKVVIKVREVLDAAGIDWIEPYSLGAESTDYRFIVPKISIFR